MSEEAEGIAPSEPPSAPGRIGRFEVVAALGTGGMASVWLARALGDAGFQRLVAIKVMHANLATDESFVDMFMDEARVAARIRHPNVVPIVDLGREGERPFTVMDYIEGDTLSAVQQAALALKRSIPIPLLLRIILDVLGGLHAAHELRGDDGAPLLVVHRDVAPQNIIVGIDGLARLSDFGVARAESRLSITDRGMLKGRMGFIPPEVVQGKAADLRADLYAVGVTLWESVSLRSLFPGRNEGERVNAILRAEYPPLRSFDPTVPAALDAILERTLSADPDRRQPSAAALADIIEQVLPDRIATHREVARFMSAVAAKKIAAERSAVQEVAMRGAGAHATSSVRPNPNAPGGRPRRSDPWVMGRANAVSPGAPYSVRPELPLTTDEEFSVEVTAAFSLERLSVPSPVTPLPADAPAVRPSPPIQAAPVIPVPTPVPAEHGEIVRAVPERPYSLTFSSRASLPAPAPAVPPSMEIERVQTLPPLPLSMAPSAPVVTTSSISLVPPTPYLLPAPAADSTGAVRAVATARKRSLVVTVGAAVLATLAAVLVGVIAAFGIVAIAARLMAGP